MEEYRYVVKFNNDVIAKGMRMSDAVILIKALADAYAGDMAAGSEISLKEMERPSLGPKKM